MGRRPEVDGLGGCCSRGQGGGHRRNSGTALGCDRLLGRRRRSGDSVEDGGEALLEFARIGRGDEGSTGRAGEATQRLELVCLAAEADHVDAESLRLLLQRDGGRADVGVAGIAAIGNENDIEAAWRLRCLGGVAQSGRNGGLAFRLDAFEELALRLGGELAGLRQDLAVGAVRRLAVAEGDESEGEAIPVGSHRLAKLGAHGRDLACAPDLRVHAARGVEHDDGGGDAGIGGGRNCVLGCGGARSKQSGGQEHEPKARAAFPPHSDRSDQSGRKLLYPVSGAHNGAKILCE